MGFGVILSPNAARQVTAAAAWWRTNRPAAPTLLVDELAQALARLAETPGVGTPWRGERRRLLLHRSEYLVVYRVRHRARRVEVLALWHARRHAPP